MDIDYQLCLDKGRLPSDIANNKIMRLQDEITMLKCEIKELKDIIKYPKETHILPGESTQEVVQSEL